jgi:ceramide glucosyltransferase
LHGTPPAVGEPSLDLGAGPRGAFEVLFIVRDPADPAAAIAEAAMAAHPGVPARLCATRGCTAQPQGSQLLNWRAGAPSGAGGGGLPTCAWSPDWLSPRDGARGDPGVGLATCLYRAEPADGRLCRARRRRHRLAFLPNAALGEAMGRRGLLRRHHGVAEGVLDRIGGFAPCPTCWRTTTAWGSGAALGLRVAVAPAVPRTWRTEAGLRDCWRHELRWARTLRSLAPAGYLGMGVTHPLAWGLWRRRWRRRDGARRP